MDAALHALSPLDGRYSAVGQTLSPYFSEFALIRYRLHVEVEYLAALKGLDLAALAELGWDKIERLRHAVAHFSEEDALHIKSVEKVTNHDVKAVEYFLKDKLTAMGVEKAAEFVHFGLTSQDINNTAFPLSLKAFHDWRKPRRYWPKRLPHGAPFPCLPAPTDNPPPLPAWARNSACLWNAFTSSACF